MRRVILGGIVALTTVVSSCSQTPPSPPVARVQPHTLSEHGTTRVDDYYWLRERDNPEVVAYLEAENAYTEAVMAPAAGLQEELFQEIKGRIRQDDTSVPFFRDGFFYYSRYETGMEYPVYCRKEGSLDAEEHVMLDVNQLAEGHEFCDVAGLAVSSSRDILAYAVDTVGRRKYTIRFRNLITGETLAEAIPEVTSDLAWAEDNRTLFYVKQHPETLRHYQVYRHVLGASRAEAELVYEEPDETFSLSVRKTKSRRYILISSRQTLSTEVRYRDASDPAGAFSVIQPRERGIEYEVSHLGDWFFIRTNLDALDFRLVKAPVANPGRAAWQEVIPHRPGVLLDEVELFRDFLVVAERRDALTRLRVIPWDGSAGHEIELEEPAHVTWIDVNPELDTGTLRFGYSSMTTPDSIYDYDMETRTRTLMKRDPVLGDFDPSHYVTERLTAPARDGAGVPLSLVYRKGLDPKGDNPLLLYAYGSYGYSIDPWFKIENLTLLDRGFVYAIAHVRGGQQLGRAWYEAGRVLHKKNTFNDFIDCAQFLIDTGWTSPERLFARGGSAGGLLMGAVANMAPQLFAGIIANVPYVDVITTMMDDDIPLTTSEYDEWGDPNDEQAYGYMLSYSPYDNVTAQAYPAMLITTGLHDSQVQYWEPAKWTARLRATKTDDNVLLLKTHMGAGHGGPSGRFTAYREDAFELAFLLTVLQHTSEGAS